MDRWERWTWAAGIVYVVALRAEAAIAVGIGLILDLIGFLLLLVFIVGSSVVGLRQREAV